MYALKMLNDAGRSGSGGVVGVINTDDGRKYAEFTGYENGRARVSHPAGYYSAMTDVETFGRDGFTDRIVPLADFTISGNDQTITFDARTARFRVAVYTPRRGRRRHELV